MTYLKSARTIGIAAFAMAAAAFTPPAKRVAGITFDAVTTTTLPVMGGNGGGTVVITMHGLALPDGSTRLDISDVQLPPTGGTPPYVVGDYLLQLQGHFVLVHPALKSYTDVADQWVAGLKNLPPQVLASMSITDIKGETNKVEGSDVIEGRGTQHYRTTMDYTMNMAGQAMSTNVATDYWVAALPVKFATPYVPTEAPVITDGPLAELMKRTAALRPEMKEGVPVKVVTSMSSTMMGQKIMTSTTNELKNVKEGDVDAAKFVLPAGFTKAK